MTDLTQFSALVALWAVGFGLFAFLFTRLDKRIDRLEDRFEGLENRFTTEIGALRHDLAEEFRAQRAEVSAQVAAFAAAINASRG